MCVCVRTRVCVGERESAHVSVCVRECTCECVWERVCACECVRVCINDFESSFLYKLEEKTNFQSIVVC